MAQAKAAFSEHLGGRPDGVDRDRLRTACFLHGQIAGGALGTRDKRNKTLPAETTPARSIN